MLKSIFDRSEHVYKNSAFVELVKDAVRFFNGTPVHSLPPSTKFWGTGIYAIYYTGAHPMYSKYGELNRLSYHYPIYVGKAVPKGWRQARCSDAEDNRSFELHHRLREHSRSIQDVGLTLTDFSCRFVIFEDEGSDMIGTIEAALIKLNKPLWNTSVDGFGNHDPGNGRYQQARSDWDVVHPGRKWAEKCKGIPATEREILAIIEKHLKTLGG